MAQDKKDNRIIIEGDEARAKLLEGATDLYRSVASTYGPKGLNVSAEKPFGRPSLTRDGVTVSRETYFSDRAKNQGTQYLQEASETTNRIAGDGTTATVVLGYNLIKNGIQAIAGGVHPMDLRTTLGEDQWILLGDLGKLSKPIKKSQLREVATVSAGDPELGQLIADAIEKVGPDGGIITEKAPIETFDREFVDGYYLQPGFKALQGGKKELVDPFVIVSTRRLSSSADVIEILTKTAQAYEIQPGTIMRLLFVGNIEDAAYNTIVENINRGVIDAVILQTPPSFGEMGKDLLDDIAIYAGCEALNEATNMRDFGGNYIGKIDKVIASKTEATLFAQPSEAVEERVSNIKEDIKTEISDAAIEKLKERIAKLEGKIALFKIGGNTETNKEEKEFRVEDAILATKAAYQNGVVAGGGITLLELSKSPKISEITRKSLRSTFEKLLTNANLPEQLKLSEAMVAPKGFGFNLRSDNGDMVDMVGAGILDPTLVVEQIIKNATTVAGDLLTIGTMLIFEDRKEE